MSNIKTTYALHQIIPDNHPNEPVLSTNLRPQTKQHNMTWTNIKYWLNKLNNGALIMGLFFLFVIIKGIYGYFLYNKMKISHRYKITSVYISKVWDGTHRSLAKSIDYQYKVNNKNYELSRTLNTDNIDVFKGKVFPLLYDSTNPTIHQILITRSDFAEYGLVPPDSLAWVEKYVRY